MRNRIVLSSLLLCLAITLAGCSSKPGGGSLAVNKPSAGGGQVIGAGSTFVYPVMSRWIDDYHRDHPDVQINYQSIGSGGGIQQLKQGVVNFGASDLALDDNQLKEMPALVQIPESAGPVCITYNLPDLSHPLKLSGSTLSAIYLGTIKNWQDPAIKKDNPGVNLPSQNVVVVHRSDGSGTTNIVTTYLSAVNSEWQKKGGQGLSISWPTGIGGKGSEGVTGLVKQNPGAIGYVELTYAEENKLPVAQIQNKAGKFVSPSAEGASAAIDAFSQQLSQNIRQPIVDPPASAANAYPISGLTFLLVPKSQQDSKKAAQVKEFVGYVISNGQSTAQQLHYAALPQSLQNIDKQLLDQVQAGS
jgi:phosphate transport system substrate-binding protein